MSDIAESLSRAAGSAFEALGADPAYGAFSPCADRARGDFQCVGVMPAAKASGQPPRRFAEAVAAALAGHPDVASVEVAGPGFVNVRVSGAALLRAVSAEGAFPSRGRAVVDHGGPNIATIRNGIEDSVSVRVPSGWVPTVGLPLTEAMPSPMGDGMASRRR